MSDKQEIIDELRVAYISFAVLFVIFAAVMLTIDIQILRDIRAFNECSSVEDYHFTACYESHQ